MEYKCANVPHILRTVVILRLDLEGCQRPSCTGFICQHPLFARVSSSCVSSMFFIVEDEEGEKEKES